MYVISTSPCQNAAGDGLVHSLGATIVTPRDVFLCVSLCESLDGWWFLPIPGAPWWCVSVLYVKSTQIANVPVAIFFGNIRVWGSHLLRGVLCPTDVLKRSPASTLKPAALGSHVVCIWGAAMATMTTSVSAAPITMATTSWVEATINECWWTVETSLGRARDGRLLNRRLIIMPVLTAYRNIFSLFFSVVCRFCTSKWSFGYFCLWWAMLVFVNVLVHDWEKKVLVEEFWSALGVPKHFMFWYSKKWSTKTLFNSVFPRCRWGCLYYKVLSLFSQSLYNRNRHQAASHHRAAAAATALLLPPLRCRRTSRSAAAVFIVVFCLRHCPSSALLSIICFVVHCLCCCSRSALTSGWQHCRVHCHPSCASSSVICIDGRHLRRHPLSVSLSIVCVIVRCVHCYPSFALPSIMCIVVYHVHCCPSSALPSVICVIVWVA